MMVRDFLTYRREEPTVSSIHIATAVVLTLLWSLLALSYVCPDFAGAIL